MAQACNGVRRSYGYSVAWKKAEGLLHRSELNHPVEAFRPGDLYDFGVVMEVFLWRLLLEQYSTPRLVVRHQGGHSVA